MRKQMLEINEKLRIGAIEENEAQRLLLILFSASTCTTCNDEINYKGVCEICYTELKNFR